MSARERGIYRRVYFYRIAHKEDVLPILSGDLQRIANLPFTDEGRYLPDGDDGRLTVWPDRLEWPIRLRFGRTRLSNLPTKELAGKLESLNLFSNQGLAELCHVVIYSDGFVAAEFNFEGPRLKRLGDYLYAKRQRLKTKPKFLPLFQKDILALVKNMPVVNFLELKGQPSATSLLARADENLAKAYAAIGDVGANKSIMLGLAAENHPESRLKRLSLNLASLVRSSERDVRDEVSKLVVRGIGLHGRTDEVDLLEDHLIALKLFERQSPKARAVSTEAAYAQIESAFEERRKELEEAVQGRSFN